MGGVPDISVVVATRDRPQRLATLLESLRTQSLPADRFEVVVVDDASGEETREVLRVEAAREALNLDVVRRPSRGGPASARNQGWRRARAPVVAFTDDDCEAAPQWVEALLAQLGDGREQIVQGQTLPNPRELDAHGPFTRTIRVTELGPFFQTCNIAYPRALLERLEGFDESYPLPGGEDTDLAWRALEQEVPAVYAEGALVHHAVQNLGLRGMLELALRWSDSMQVFGRHPGLRSRLAYGIFWKHTHALLIQAAAGLVAARKWRLCLLLVLPYLRELRGRCIHAHASLWYMSFFALYDLVELYATLRGAARHRVLVA